jgi:hypothetical protein
LLLWRLPAGPRDLPALRPALALTLAWLVCSPQQRPWFDAMIFPLLALMPASGVDWVALGRAAAAAAAELPGVIYYSALRPAWLGTVVSGLVHAAVPAVLAITTAVLVWLCLSGRLARPPDDPALPGWPRRPASAGQPASSQPGGVQPGSARAGLSSA